MKIISKIKHIIKVFKLSENEFCNSEPCWCHKCDKYYRQNYIEALKKSGIKIINLSEVNLKE